jgi:hypothetical protein
MLNTIAGENFDFVIVHADRNADDDRALRALHPLKNIRVTVHCAARIFKNFDRVSE